MATQPETVDEYIRAFPAEVQPLLEQVRQDILHMAPEAEESISYGMPTLSIGGQYLVYFAGWKRHIALYAIPTLSPDLERAIAPYRSDKDTVKFPLAQPIPHELIRRVVGELLAWRDGVAG
ncbi:MAG: DUF1801 domain-containing protein [Microbacteriaceae bacterium]